MTGVRHFPTPARRRALGSILAVLVCPLLLAAAGPTITYRRVFKGSNPEFIEIKIAEDGTASYDVRQLSENPDPQPFAVGEAVRTRVFELAGELHEVHYTYTLNRSATQLALVFEGLFQQQRDLLLLEQRLKYDRLGVNDALHQFEDDLGQHTLPEPERLVPVLDRIAADARVVDVARQLARALAERIRTTSSAPGLTQPAGSHP